MRPSGSPGGAVAIVLHGHLRFAAGVGTRGAGFAVLAFVNGTTQPDDVVDAATSAFLGVREIISIEEFVQAIQGDGRGHLLAKCEARDPPGVGNTLRFKLTFDQTELPPVLAALDEVVRVFPVRGSRDQKHESPEVLPRGFIAPRQLHK